VLPHGLASKRGNSLPEASNLIRNPPGTLTAPLRRLSSAQVRKEIPIRERIARGARGVKIVKNELLVGRIRSWARRDWRTVMLWTILVILVVLWLLGMVSSYTMGGFIHILLVVAVVILIIRLVSGRRVV
jgi:hypothetical protein